MSLDDTLRVLKPEGRISDGRNRYRARKEPEFLFASAAYQGDDPATVRRRSGTKPQNCGLTHGQTAEQFIKISKLLVELAWAGTRNFNESGIEVLKSGMRLRQEATVAPCNPYRKTPEKISYSSIGR